LLLFLVIEIEDYDQTLVFAFLVMLLFGQSFVSSVFFLLFPVFYNVSFPYFCSLRQTELGDGNLTFSTTSPNPAIITFVSFAVSVHTSIPKQLPPSPLLLFTPSLTTATLYHNLPKS